MGKRCRLIKLPIAFAVYLVLPLFLCPDKATIEKKAVIRVVELFFTMLETRDQGLASEILIEGGVTFSTRKERSEESSLRRTEFKDLVDSLSRSTDAMKEQISNPKVLLHGDIAVLWAPYKFYINGSYSHKGVDAFNLVKIKGKWRIASIVYTVEIE